MTNYLVTMALIFGGYNGTPFYVTCLANDSQLKHLKMVTYHNEGGCCSQEGCIECRGLEIRYHDSMKIKGSRQMKVAEFVNSKCQYNLEYFLKWMVGTSEDTSGDTSGDISE